MQYSATVPEGRCAQMAVPPWSMKSGPDPSTVATPVTVTVRDLSYCVAAKEWLPGCISLGGCRKSVKALLNDVNLIVKPGELLAILGPSGSGKTTLLNVLGMRSQKSRITRGAVHYNGHVETQKSVKKKVNYVMAHDKLLPYLTVVETFIFAAQLKLPLFSAEKRMERVERILDKMQLQHCRNTFIGGDWCRGISTGELKRVAIGVELIDDPPLMILDEPTSGLDSVLGVRIVDLLRAETCRGKTIVATVHQPTTQVFNMFHSVALLSEGRVVYHGPTRDVMSYFERLGFAPKGDWNPSDFLLELVSTPRPSAPLDGATAMQRPAALAQAWSESKEARHVAADIASTEATATPADAASQLDSSNDSSRNLRPPVRAVVGLWLHEAVCLWRRTILNTIRNPLSWLVVLLIQIMQALIIGGIMFQRTQVTNGPAPDPLGSDSFWEHAWTRAFNWGTNWKGNRPILSAFELGLDGQGSFGVSSPNETGDEWLDRIHFFVDKSLTCLHQTYRLPEMGYPAIPDFNEPPSENAASWEPRRIYSNIMAGYQFLDLIATTRSTWGINFGYFDHCNATIQANIQVDLCVQYYSRAFNPMLQCFNLWPLDGFPAAGDPGWSPEPPSLRPELRSWHRPSTPEWELKADAFALKRQAIWDELLHQQFPETGVARLGELDHSTSTARPKEPDPQNPLPQSDTLVDGHDIRREDLSGSNPHEERLDELLAQLPVVIQDMIDQNLRRFLIGVVEWVVRSTECEDPICESLFSLRKSIETMSSSTADTVLGLLNLAGCLFFVATILGFASYDSLLTFPQERALFNRESANGLYHTSSYYIAKNLADAPFQLVPCCIMGTILYFMIGFEASFGAFVVYVVLCVLTTFCAYGFGYMVSAASPRMEVAILVAPLTLTIWLVLAGFFLRDGDIPVWIDWFKYLSFYRWAFFGLVANQFPTGGYFGTIPNSVAQAIVGVTVGNTGVCVTILIALGVFYRLAGFVFLAYTNRTVGLEA